MFKKNFIFVLFYFALTLVIGVSLYFYSSIPPYSIIVGGGFFYIVISILHLLLAGGKKTKTNLPRNNMVDMVDEKLSANKKNPANKTIASRMMAGRGDKKNTDTVMAGHKATSKPVNALQDIFKSAYQNELLVDGRAMVMFGHDVVSPTANQGDNQGENQVVGLYCQGYIEYHNGQGHDTASIIADSPKGSIASDIEILLLETLRHYWQKTLKGEAMPYCFFPISERALNEKGFINDLKSFLKSQKIAYPALAKAFARLVIVLPFTSGLYRHTEACQFLSSEGIKLGLLYSSSKNSLLNPILDDDPSLLLRMGIDFYLLSVDDLQMLQENLGYEVMSEKILSLQKIRLMMLVFNIDDEVVYNSLPRGIAMVMGNLFDKQTLLARLPLLSDGGGGGFNNGEDGEGGEGGGGFNDGGGHGSSGYGGSGFNGGGGHGGEAGKNFNDRKDGEQHGMPSASPQAATPYDALPNGVGLLQSSNSQSASTHPSDDRNY